MIICLVFFSLSNKLQLPAQVSRLFMYTCLKALWYAVLVDGRIINILVAVEAVLYVVLHVVDIKVEKNRSQDGAMWYSKLNVRES